MNENDVTPATIEFNMHEDFSSFAKADRLAIALISSGKATFVINGKKIPIVAPCAILSSLDNTIELADSDRLSAKSLNFHPAFINKNAYPDNKIKNNGGLFENEGAGGFTDMQFRRGDFFYVASRLQPQKFMQISEWFNTVAREGKNNSGVGIGQRRVRRCLMLMLLSLEEIIESQNETNASSDEYIIDNIIEYIHANYVNDISIRLLCKIACMNRTTLNRKFKARARRSPIDYLLHYRLNIACEMLTYTKLSISRIAEATGFNYETYFIRQFMAKIGITPTQYRQSEGYETLNNIESRIVDEL